MFRIAHISDLHLAPLPSIRMREVLNKRLLGYLSWQRQRRYRHRSDVLAKLRKDVLSYHPDHICITGDLTNIALPNEFEAATAWLQDLSPPEQVSLIPGNHDAYVKSAVDLMGEYWPAWIGSGFPYLHKRGPLAVIGLSTAVATWPFMASGSLGKEQLRKFQAMLEETATAGLKRVVLLHHPPLARAATWRKSLHDGTAFRAIIARSGAELILHGHCHRPTHGSLPGPAGIVPVYGAGSASLYSERSGHGAHYHLFEFENNDVRVTHRQYDPENFGFTSSRQDELEKVT